MLYVDILFYYIFFFIKFSTENQYIEFIILSFFIYLNFPWKSAKKI